jgi:hypothetical protein
MQVVGLCSPPLTARALPQSHFSILPAFASGFGGRSLLHYTVFTFPPARAMT